MALEDSTRRNSRSVWVAWTVVPPMVGAVGRVAWRLQIERGPGFPTPPFVVAANHHSFLDGFLIAAAHREKIRFLALDDLFGNHRWVDFALGAFDVIAVKRGSVPLGPVREALAHLSSGGVVGLFPEGTRHQEFRTERARRGAAWLAAHSGAPLVPVAISGTERVLGIDNRLRAGRIRVAVGPKLEADGTSRDSIDDLMARWGDWVGTNQGAGVASKLDGRAAPG